MQIVTETSIKKQVVESMLELVRRTGIQEIAAIPIHVFDSPNLLPPAYTNMTGIYIHRQIYHKAPQQVGMYVMHEIMHHVTEDYRLDRKYSNKVMGYAYDFKINQHLWELWGYDVLKGIVPGLSNPKFDKLSTGEIAERLTHAVHKHGANCAFKSAGLGICPQVAQVVKKLVRRYSHALFDNALHGEYFYMDPEDEQMFYGVLHEAAPLLKMVYGFNFISAEKVLKGCWAHLYQQRAVATYYPHRWLSPGQLMVFALPGASLRPDFKGKAEETLLYCLSYLHNIVSEPEEIADNLDRLKERMGRLDDLIRAKRRWIKKGRPKASNPNKRYTLRELEDKWHRAQDQYRYWKHLVPLMKLLPTTKTESLGVRLAHNQIVSLETQFQESHKRLREYHDQVKIPLFYTDPEVLRRLRQMARRAHRHMTEVMEVYKQFRKGLFSLMTTPPGETIPLNRRPKLLPYDETKITNPADKLKTKPGSKIDKSQPDEKQPGQGLELPDLQPQGEKGNQQRNEELFDRLQAEVEKENREPGEKGPKAQGAAKDGAPGGQDGDGAEQEESDGAGKAEGAGQGQDKGTGRDQPGQSGKPGKHVTGGGQDDGRHGGGIADDDEDEDDEEEGQEVEGQREIGKHVHAQHGTGDGGGGRMQFMQFFFENFDLLKNVMFHMNEIKSKLSKSSSRNIGQSGLVNRNYDLDNDVTRILPSEMAMLSSKNDFVRLSFLDKFARHSLLSVAPPETRRFPVAILVDGSGSMKGLYDMALGYALAMITKLNEDRRGAVLMVFSGRVERTVVIEPGTPVDVMYLLSVLCSPSFGGTNFDVPTLAAFDVRDRCNWRNILVQLISDGDCGFYRLPEIQTRKRDNDRIIGSLVTEIEYIEGLDDLYHIQRKGSMLELVHIGNNLL